MKKPQKVKKVHKKIIQRQFQIRMAKKPKEIFKERYIYIYRRKKKKY